MEPGVSIILCCHNSEKRLPKVLDCLNNQKNISDISWEILLVDNASTDGTVEIAKRYSTACKLPIRILPESRIGLSFARMTGINASRYDIICYVDDDNWLNDQYIASVYQIMMTHSDVGLCGGYGIAAFENDPPAWFNNFQEAYAVGPQGKEAGYLPGNCSLIYGAGLTLRKSAWLKLENNGFNYILTGRKGKSLSSGEDSELCLAIQLAGYKIWYDPALTFEHFMPSVRLTYAYLIKLFEAFGRSDVILGIYFSEFEGKLKKMVIQNYFLCLLYYLYALKTPLKNSFLGGRSEIQKMASNLFLKRNLAKIKEHLGWFGKYSSAVKSIGSIKFVNLHNQA